MRILLDAFPLFAPLSGVGYYTLRLLKGLREEYQTDTFTYFYGRRFSREILEAAPSFDAGLRTLLKSRLKKPYKLIQPIKETLFRLGAPFCRADIYHETNYVPLPYNGPQVVTVFDMSLLRFPKTHPKDRRCYFEDYFLKRLPRADRIITISEFSKRELVELCGVSPEIIRTIYLGGLEAPIPAPQDLQNFRQEKKLPPRFFLYTGNLEPRKNLPLLIEAYSLAKTKDKKLPPLLLAGNASWLSDSIFSSIEKLKLKDCIIPIGYVPARELPYYYALCEAFLFPSKYEGFGLPVLEAMGCGAPVLTSDASSLPEVAGDAARLLPPDNPEIWAENLLRLAQDETIRKEMTKASLNQARKFSWRRCAKETHKVYEEILD